MEKHEESHSRIDRNNTESTTELLLVFHCKWTVIKKKNDKNIKVLFCILTKPRFSTIAFDSRIKALIYVMLNEI